MVLSADSRRDMLGWMSAIQQVTHTRTHTQTDLTDTYTRTLKVARTRLTERRFPELIPVLGSQPAGDVSHKPGSRLPLLCPENTSSHISRHLEFIIEQGHSPGQLGLRVAGFPGHWVAGSQNVTQFHLWRRCCGAVACVVLMMVVDWDDARLTRDRRTDRLETDRNGYSRFRP